MPEYPTILSDLAEDDRKHINECIRTLLRRLRSCEARLKSYEAGEDLYKSGSVFKLINDLKETSVMVDEMTNQVVTKHRLPDGLKLIDEAFRLDFSNFPLGIALE
jgi:hypothetical protein